jgi:serine/threonine protein kinase
MIQHYNFKIIKCIGKGTYSIITLNLIQGEVFLAIDLNKNINVALKIEKEGVPRNFLMHEFLILSSIQNKDMAKGERQRVPKVYQFYSGEKRNFFAMELFGSNMNIDNYKGMNKYLLLNEMLSAIEEIHDKGIVHLDIKPTNFVIGFNTFVPEVYLIDFGLSRPYVNDERYDTVLQLTCLSLNFIGTIKYASLNSHMKGLLGRQDDLWSYFFIILEFLDIKLPWDIYYDKAAPKCDLMEKIEHLKERFIRDNHFEVYLSSHQNCDLLIAIFRYIKNLKFDETPDYNFIRYAKFIKII